MDDINDILNIARDEGLTVTTRKESEQFGWDYPQYYIDRYPLDENGDNNKDNLPLMDNDKFVSIIRDVYNRLDNDGHISHHDSFETGKLVAGGSNCFYYSIEPDSGQSSGFSVLKKTPINSDILENEITFAGIDII